MITMVNGLDPLTKLTLALSRNTLSNSAKHKAICCCVTSVIPEASRVSLWKFNEDRSAIRCLMLKQGSECVVTENVILKEADFPDYFRAILQQQLVVASNARTHADTRCFNTDYFEPNGIYSLLDYIFQENFKAVGVICCEATGSKVQWHSQDIAVLKRIATVTSMFFKE